MRVPETFYSQKFIDYRSNTTDDNRLCTELIAEYLLREENYERLNGIATQSRTAVRKKYNMGHQGKYPPNADHRSEKIIGIDLFNQCKEQGTFDHIGKILDYQIPLKTQRSDPYGEIDLLSVNEDENIVYFLELKKKNAKVPATMLHCVLEAFTYYRIVDTDNLLKEFGKQGAAILIAPLVFAGDEQYKEWVDMNNGNRPYLKALMQKMRAVPFFLYGDPKKNDKCGYTVKEK